MISGPSESDASAWALNTWRCVICGALCQVSVAVDWTAHGGAGALVPGAGSDSIIHLLCKNVSLNLESNFQTAGPNPWFSSQIAAPR